MVVPLHHTNLYTWNGIQSILNNFQLSRFDQVFIEPGCRLTILTLLIITILTILTLLTIPILTGSQSLQPPLPGSTWLSRHLLWHKVPKIFDLISIWNCQLRYFLKVIERYLNFLLFCRTGFNNIVPYNATRQGMPGYELPGVLRDPLMTVDPQKTFAPHILCCLCQIICK